MGGSVDRAEARSTVVPRFAEGGIAGPGVEHHLRLLLRYFPGDGEAVLRTEIGFDRSAVELLQVRSSLGKATSDGEQVRVDYQARPVDRASVDTLAIAVRALLGDADTRWQARIYTSADPEGAAAHSAAFSLRLQPPVPCELAIGPEPLFPGQQVEVALVLRNLDPRGRRIAAAHWEWPAGVVGEESAAVHRWPAGLAAGQQDTIRALVRVSEAAAGPLAVAGRVDADGVVGSPVAGGSVMVVAAPWLRVAGAAGRLDLGQRARLACQWTNPADAPVALAAVEVQVPAGFAEVELAGPADGVRLDPSPSGPTRSVRVDRETSLGPGDSAGVELWVRPNRPGLFAWKGSFRPAGVDAWVPMAGEALVQVAEPAGAPRQATGETAVPTDLELMQGGLRASLEAPLRELTLGAAASVYLEPEDRAASSWLVEEVLAELLMQRGIRVAFAPPAPGEPRGFRLSYRVADAAVVYSPRRGWNPFAGRTVREACGRVFLRLEDPAGPVRWARRAQVYQADRVPSVLARRLGGSEAVKRTVVASDHRLVGRLLSGSILGGLVYVFFVP